MNRKNMKKILIASIALILPSVILSSSLNIKNINDDEWNVKFELPPIYIDMDVIKLEDGYMILTGSDIWLTKLDKRGNLIWEKCVSSGNRELPATIVELEDGFAIGGYAERVDNDLFLIKTDKSGDLLWRKTYGKKGVAEFGGRVIKVRGGFLLVGEQADIFWVLKVDEEGNEIWNRTFFEKGEEWGEGCDALEIEDGYLLLGLCYSNGRIGLVKVDENGNEIWNKTYSRGAYEGDATIIKIEDGYLIGGWGELGLPFLLKIDKEGNIIWYNNYLGGSIFFKDIGEVEDGYTAVGYWQIKNIGGFDILLLKVDKDTGYPIWYKNFGGRDDDFGYRLLIENKSYFIFGEYGKRGPQGGKGVMIKCADYAPPEINITRPKENYLYIFDREIMPYDYTFVIGKITIEAEVYNPSNAIIKRIEFYIDRIREYTYEPVKILYSPPYQWTVDIPLHGWITLTAGLYYGDAEGVVGVRKDMRIIKLI